MLRIPLPNAPAGSVMEGMGQANALSGQMLENQIKKVQAQYAPLTTQAEAASKLAYANLMGPQFLAKLMGNQSVVANSPQLQDPATIARLYQAGMGQGTGFGLLSQLQQQPQQMQQPQNFNPFSRVLGGIRNLFNPPQKTVQSVFGTQSLPAQDQRNISQMQPGDAYTVGSNQAPAQVSQSLPNQSGESYFERSGREQGVESQGKEAGKLRADTIAEMGKQYSAGLKLNDAYQELTDLINEPDFQKMRADIPLFQDKQMAALSKIGTPHQQEMIGKFKQAAQKILANAVNSFEGRKFLGEFKTTNDMKINDNDTFNTIVGKMQAGRLLNNFDQQRIAIASGLMKNNHLDEQEALQKADEQLDRKKIENDIKNLVKITIRNKNTGEIKTIPIHEARAMGVPRV